MINLQCMFSNLNRSIKDSQFPIDTNGIIKCYYGISSNGFFRISFLSKKNTGIKGTTKSIDIVQGNSNDDIYWTCFDLKNDDLLSVFCTFGEDLISSIFNEKNENIASAKLRFRFSTWLALFKKSKNPFSLEKAKGLFGELYFLKKYMLEVYGVENSIRAWSGPDMYSKDFAISDHWYEIKTISAHSNAVKISSIQQLASDYVGHLIVVTTDEMADTFSGKDSSINELIQFIISEIADDNVKDEFLEKLSNIEYDMCDELGDKKYQVLKMYKYIVDDKFPILRESDIKSKAISNISYELVLKLLDDFLEVK